MVTTNTFNDEKDLEIVLDNIKQHSDNYYKDKDIND